MKCVISCPLNSYSGYGRRSLDFVKQLIQVKPDWDIKILSQRWGETRMGYLWDHNETDLISRLVPSIKEKPDIWIQITVPNEFQPVGKYNIGMTAAMETTLCDASWVQGCNRMDLVLVSSKHSKTSLTNSKYVDNRTQEPLEVTTPIEILFEGVDQTRYHKTVKAEERDLFVDTPISNWNFLCVGHWMQGDFGQDRKNIGYTIKTFLETFKNVHPAPGLVLKTCRATSSIIDRYEILDRIYAIREAVLSKDPQATLPEIYLLHGDLSDYEMNAVYNDPRIKAMVSFTKGEGFGRPLLEFATVGKPVLCSGWSGQLDFLGKDYTAFVGGRIDPVHPSAVVKNMILPEASWFTPDDRMVDVGFKELYYNYTKWSKLAKQQAKIINSKFSLESMGKKTKELLDKYVFVPQQVELQLPEE